MTDGPRRLNQSGGRSQRLLDSASLDKPSHNSRRLAENLAATASAFASTRPGPNSDVRPIHPVRTLATWIGVGAAASVVLGFVASTLLQPAGAPQAAAPLATVETAAHRAAAPSDISAEPAASARPNASDPSHPNGTLTPESMALRIQTLSSSGKATEARALANEFLAKYPTHPLAEQVRRAIEK